MSDFCKEIKKIKFGIFSPEENKKRTILNFSNIEKHNINDPKLGSVTKNITCITCGFDNIYCTGHFGLIEFSNILLNPIFKKSLTNILKIICHKCSSFIIDPNIFPPTTTSQYKINNAILLSENVKKCNNCEHSFVQIKTLEEFFQKNFESDVKINKNVILYNILDNIQEKDVEQMGLEHPKKYFLSNLQIIPPSCRISQEMDGKQIDGDLTILSNEIIKSSKKKIDYNRIEDKIAMFEGIKQTQIPSRGNRTIEGIKSKISRKEGLIRNNLLGKRVDYSARTVLGPEPYLKSNEIGLPEKIAKSLTTKEILTNFNYNYIRKIFTEGKILSFEKNHKIFYINKIKLTKNDIILNSNKQKEEILNDRILCFDEILLKDNKEIKYKFHLEIGDSVNRQLKDGDYILVNRQPTLHIPSMMSFRIKLHKDKTLKLPLSVTKAFNADFDGDEKSIYIPQNYDVKAELMNLSTPENCLLSYKDGYPNLSIVQDTLLAVHIMSMDVEKNSLTKTQFYHICYSINGKNGVAKNVNGFNGVNILYNCFPENFNFHSFDVSIKQGLIVSGNLNKNNINKIIKIISNEYNNSKSVEFIDDLQSVSREWNMVRTFSIGLVDCLPISTEKNLDELDLLKHLLTNNNPDPYEEKIITTVFSRIRDAEMKKAKENMIKEKNNFIKTIESGSKGDYVNATQITAMLGQQTINSGRILNCLTDGRSFPHSFKNLKKMNEFDIARNQGFISSSFATGLTPIEFFTHAMSGRQGVVDSATSTSKTGYRMRRNSRIMENIVTQYDNSIRDNLGNIYSFYNGIHGYDPSKLINTKYGKQIFNCFRFYEINKSKLDPILMRKFSQKDAEFLLDFIDEDLTHTVPNIIFDNLKLRRKENIKLQFQDFEYIDDEFLNCLKKILKEKYYTTASTPGQCVGLIAAQCLGESSTQATLNNFHSAGQEITKNVSTSSVQLEQLFNIKKTIDRFYMKLNDPTITRDDVEKKINGVKIIDFIDSVIYFENAKNLFEKSWFKNFIIIYETAVDINKICIKLVLKKNMLLKYKFKTIDMYNELNTLIKKNYDDVNIVFSSMTSDEIEMYIVNVKEEYNQIRKILNTTCFGMNGVYSIDSNNDEFIAYVNSEKISTKQFIINNETTFKLPINYNTLISDSVFEIYNDFGIEVAKNFLINEIVKLNSNVDISHILLIVNKMTFSGNLEPISRYGLKDNTTPIHRASFEENFESFIKAAKYKEEDDIQNSIAVMFGKIPRVGTYFPEMIVDWKKYNKINKHEIKDDQMKKIPEEDEELNEELDEKLDEDEEFF